MSGKHQRRMWVLPVPTGSTSRYDRMQIAVGRAMSTTISIEHDTLTKVLTSIISLFDTCLRVIVQFISSAPYGEASGRILESPFWTRKKKDKLSADEVFKLEKIDISKTSKKAKYVKIKVNSILETKMNIGDAKLVDERSPRLSVEILKEENLDDHN